MKANPADIFNYVVESLPNGETLAIKCNDERQVDRIRTALYRQRAKFEKIAPMAASVITISKRTDSKDFAVIIGKNIESFKFSIIDKDGNESSLNTTITGNIEEIQKRRIEQLMLDEGKSEEEIKEYFQNQATSIID